MKKKISMWTALILTVLLVCALLLCGFKMHPVVMRESGAPQEMQQVTVFSLSGEDTFSAVRRAMLEERGVEVVCGGDTLAEEIATVRDLRAGTVAYDVLHLGYGMMYEYDAAALIDSGLLQPLYRPVVNKAVEAMWKPLQELSMRGENVYVLPISAGTYCLHDPNDAFVRTWADYLENDGSTRWMHGLWHCLLQQYMLDSAKADFTFESDLFRETLELAKSSYNDHFEENVYAWGEEKHSLHIELGGGARIERDGALSLAASRTRMDWLPSMDGKWRIPLSVDVLAVPVGAQNAELAQDVVARMASFGLYGDNSPAIEADAHYYFGAPSAEACYNLPAQISFCVGDLYPENRETWETLMENAQVVPETEFLSEAYLQHIRPYFEGEMTVEECTQRVQTMWDAR